MRLVLDTNTAISGLLWSGTPSTLIDAAIDGRIELASSTALLAELQGVLLRDKFATRIVARRSSVEDLFAGYAALVRLVVPRSIPPTILRDPDDDIVLATALAAQADFIVSGDADLLELERFRGIPIVRAIEAMQLCLA